MGPSLSANSWRTKKHGQYFSEIGLIGGTVVPQTHLHLLHVCVTRLVRPRLHGPTSHGAAHGRVRAGARAVYTTGEAADIVGSLLIGRAPAASCRFVVTDSVSNSVRIVLPICQHRVRGTGGSGRGLVHHDDSSATLLRASVLPSSARSARGPARCQASAL